MAIYVVNDFADLTGTLEADAPLDPGGTVTFTAVPMSITLHTEGEDARQGEVRIPISNVSRLLMPHLAAVTQSMEPVEVIARVYLPSDLTAPHELPPLRVVLRGAASHRAGGDRQRRIRRCTEPALPGRGIPPGRIPGAGMNLASLIRTIQDYPKPGILFRDITTLLGDADGFRSAVDAMVERYRDRGISRVAGIEARGFILGGAVAHQLGAGFVRASPGAAPPSHARTVER